MSFAAPWLAVRGGPSWRHGESYNELASTPTTRVGPGPWVNARTLKSALLPHGPCGIRLKVAWGKAWAGCGVGVSFGEGALGFPGCWGLLLPLPQPAATHH